MLQLCSDPTTRSSWLITIEKGASSLWVIPKMMIELSQETDNSEIGWVGSTYAFKSS